MLSILTTFTAFIISMMLVPSLISIARSKNIFDEPGERKLHVSRTPLLGGVAIFAGMMISFLFWSADYFEADHLFLLSSLVILFIAGFIDDLQPLRPVVKLFLQVVATVITVLFAHIKLGGLHGLFGIHLITGIWPVMISVLFMLMLVNAFNFIDGIDGLATSIGIISSACFGLMFLSIHDQLAAILSFSLCGALAAFLRFNFSPAKIFMGDTGTLITGFTLSFLSIRLIEETRIAVSSFSWLNYYSAPVIILSLLIVPIVDFMRVTVIRMMKGQSPIHADNNHIHHVMVKAGFSHLETTLWLVAVNMAFIAATFIFRLMNQSILFFAMLSTGLLLSQIPHLLLKHKLNKSRL